MSDSTTGTSVAAGADREVMALALTTNAGIVAGVLRGTDAADEQVMGAIAATRSLALVVEDTLRALVRQARAGGRTWAEIGDVLHVTRQAAFQRFGGEQRPRPDDPEAPSVAPGAVEKATSVLEHFLAGRYDDVRATFDGTMLSACPAELLRSVREKVLAGAGDHHALGEPAVTVRLGYTVVDVPLAFEHGDQIGRVALNADGQVSGFFVLPPDAA